MLISSNALNHLAAVRRYRDLLATGDVAAAASLFSPSGVVHSQPAGTRPAAAFFDALASQPRRTDIQDAQLFVSASGSRSVCAVFTHQQPLAGNARISVPRIDVFDFDEHGFIDRLTIVGDSAALRQAGGGAQDRSAPA